MEDRAAKIQNLANRYEILAKESFASKYPDIQKKGETFLAKSKELAEEAKQQAYKEELEEIFAQDS